MMSGLDNLLGYLPLPPNHEMTCTNAYSQRKPHSFNMYNEHGGFPYHTHKQKSVFCKTMTFLCDSNPCTLLLLPCYLVEFYAHFHN